MLIFREKTCFFDASLCFGAFQYVLSIFKGFLAQILTDTGSMSVAPKALGHTDVLVSDSITGCG